MMSQSAANSTEIGLECLTSAIEMQIVRALESAGHSNDMLSLSLAAPVVPAERLLMMAGYANQTLWCPSLEDESAGVGAAVILTGSGESRFSEILASARKFFETHTVLSLDGETGPEPSFLGGLAFAPGETESDLWRGFGDARFVLPRIGYTRRKTKAWLTLSASKGELATQVGRTHLAREAKAALEMLGQPLDSSPSPPSVSKPVAEPVAEPIAEDERGWTLLVAGILAEINAGRLEKAVAARQVVLTGKDLPSPSQVLERLRDEGPHCTRFALTVGSRTFLCASPEKMVRRRGLLVWTEALAGSVRGDDPEQAQALLCSQKNGLEHAIVAREIHAMLAPLSSSLSTEGPHLLQLRHVTHLRTRFQGLLKEPMHVLDLVARLHPTPAVGGTPRRSALAWLRNHENADRGFYAGPFGVFDRAGNGEFVVALRSGLVNATQAHLFAGAGIVRGSRIQSELTETRWKLGALLAALGAS
jgi:isochorismate synthase